MRLDKILANSGYGSRSTVKQLIRRGEVQIAGQLARDPGQLLGPEEMRQISISGQAVRVRLHYHLLLHKPAGLVTALQDQKLPTIASLLPKEFLVQGLVPVGRLDRDSTGLLFLTSDGTLNHRLASPRWQISKTYLVSYRGAALTGLEVDLFARGILLDGTEPCLPARLIPGPDNTARLIIQEGKYHQVKRMLAETGRQVTGLHRTGFGPLSLESSLGPGQSREPAAGELKALYSAVKLQQPLF